MYLHAQICIGLYYNFSVDPYEPERVWFFAGMTTYHDNRGDPNTIFGEGNGKFLLNVKLQSPVTAKYFYYIYHIFITHS